MDQFRADLHIHSRFSRATSKALNAHNLAAWARVKGLTVLGTGDFTHPTWLAELEENLKDEDNGLFSLKDESPLARQIPWLEGNLPSGRTRFMLQAEISSIYKRGGKVRKVHNLIYVPSFDAAKRLNQKLDAIGNIESDGRPILGLDSRDLLEIVLGLDPMAFLVPAHIWTPWFSLFGSKSGFDSVEECFGDLAGEIFAMETGLSSDPEMNWLWSALDRYRMISNSDAHSGEKLGRESNSFSGDISYDTIYRALKGEGLGCRFLGTVEFFPEEGKYHLDGHRKCGVVMDPQETRSRGGLCPVCGKPLTVGVLNRVLELADRDTPQQPQRQPGFVSLVPLNEIIAEILGCGPNTKKVKTLYAKALSMLGPEMSILQDAPPEELKKIHPLLAEGVRRMRAGKVLRNPGFDGQYGTISVFTPSEKREMTQGGFLVKLPETAQESLPLAGPEISAENGPKEAGPAVAFNERQQQAIDAGPGPVLVLAGPGTGKTQTLMGRIDALLGQGVPPRHILAVTFTRRAALELRERLSRGRGENEALPRADTLHALAFECWRDAYGEAPVVMNEEAAKKVFAECTPELSGARLKEAWASVGLARERLEVTEDILELQQRYTKKKESWNLVDYTDLLEFWLEQIQADIYQTPFTHVLVDEVQDLSPLQLQIVRGLAGEEGRGFFAIGDPDQSIYAFRGAAGEIDARLKDFWPEVQTISLTRNYRSAQEILDISAALFPGREPLAANRKTRGEAHIFAAPDQMREASWIGERIRRLLGGTSLSQASDGAALAPGDIAVLVRFKSLVPPIERTLTRLGIPVSVPENEAFWMEPRVAAILATAASLLGMAAPAAEHELSLPQKVLAKGPVGLSAYLEDIAPFDRMFWKSKAFRDLSRAYDEQGGWAGLVNWINLRSEIEMVKARAEKVQIMTMHAAKGLEFEAVFLAGLEDGLLPFAGADFLAGKAGGGPWMTDVPEEQRLFYVGLTRAKSNLYLSHSAHRELYGSKLGLKPSRFIGQLPKDLLNASKLVARKVRQEKKLSLI